MNATQVGGRRAWWSRAVLIAGITAVVLPFLGAFGTRFGILNFKLGLLLWAIGLLIGLIPAWRSYRYSLADGMIVRF